MVEYKLRVVKTGDRKYQVSHHTEMEPKEFYDFVSLINHILFEHELYNHILFTEEPIFANLSEGEESALRGIRLLILDKKRLEDLVKVDDSKIPF